MRNHGRFLLGCAPALSALVLACGCAALPGTFGQSSEPTPSPTRKHDPHLIAGPSPSANSVAPVTGPGPAPVLPLNLSGPESPQDVISFQAQKLNLAADENKLLAARLAQLEATLQDKDRALAEAADDITKTGEEINRTRADVRRIKLENADLHDKLDRSQKEVIELRKQIIKMMESQPGEPKMEESKPE